MATPGPASAGFDVFLTPCALGPDSLKGHAVVVVDVMRASSTIVTALSNGARAVIPVADQGEATRIASSLDDDVRLLGGERGGRPIAGYDTGNSPLDYTPERTRGRTLVLTTTNGTRAIGQARAASRVAIGSFLNAGRAAGFMRDAREAGLPVSILCAGTAGRVALEDALCAGLLLSRVATADEVADFPDSAQIAYALYAGSREGLARALFGASHTQYLVALGYADDVAYCARIDTLDVLPVYRDGRILLDPAAPAALPDPTGQPSA